MLGLPEALFGGLSALDSETVSISSTVGAVLGGSMVCTSTEGSSMPENDAYLCAAVALEMLSGSPALCRNLP